MGFNITAYSDRARRTAHPPVKNRVGGLRGFWHSRARKTRSQPVGTHRERTATPAETVSGVHYYGYRFLNTEMGRWVSRDPIDERGSRLERGHLRESASLRVASASEIGHAYGFVRNQPESHIDPTGLSLTESFCNAIMPFPSGDKYLIDGGTCYNLGCLKKVCPDFLHCMLGGIGSGVKNLGTCLIGCLPSLIWGAPGYGACVGICVGADTVITIGVVSQCMTIKDKQKAACAVRMCYCQQ